MSTSPINFPRSKSFGEYIANRDTVKDLLKFAPNTSQQLASPKQQKLATTIYCSCVVLLSSYLERYVESLVVEAIDAINNANILLQLVPDQLRVSQVKEWIYDLSETLQKEMTKGNVEAMIRKSHLLHTNCQWFLEETQPFTKLKGEPLIGENRFSNPTPEKIDELFRHLGIKSLVGRVIGSESKPDRGAVGDKVKEMVEKRNNIAHTGGTVTVTFQDVASYLQYSRRLVRGIDSIVGKEIQQFAGGLWPWY